MLYMTTLVFVFNVEFVIYCLCLNWQVSHEAPVTGGFGAEISASIVERCFLRVNSLINFLI